MEKKNSKKYIAQQLDYWMLDALADAVDFAEKKYHPSMIGESMARARQTMQIAASLGVIDNEQFDNINETLCRSKLNREARG